ncbi:MAG TPA: hypothetical protein DD465_08495, partial [Thalassospira sp.]|nr:hypothetical protein [Thalassospira sp.]
MNCKQVFFIIAVLAVSLPATVCAVQAAEITPTVVYSTSAAWNEHDPWCRTGSHTDRSWCG